MRKLVRRVKEVTWMGHEDLLKTFICQESIWAHYPMGEASNLILPQYLWIV